MKCLICTIKSTCLEFGPEPGPVPDCIPLTYYYDQWDYSGSHVGVGTGKTAKSGKLVVCPVCGNVQVET